MNESKTSFKLKGVESVKVSEQSNVADLIFEGGVQGRITFLEENIFRYDVDPAGEFAAYATPRDEAHTAKIQLKNLDLILKALRNVVPELKMENF